MVSYLNLISGKILGSGEKVVLVPLSLVAPRSSTLALRRAALVALIVELAVAPDFDLEFLAERVDYRGADAMQAARDLVHAAIELAARVQHGMHDFERRALFGRMHIDRDAAAVVLDRDLVVAQDDDVDLVAVTSQRLVDRVVDDLVDQVMQSALGGVADIHSGALAYRLETLENPDRLGAVTVLRLLACHRKGSDHPALTTIPPAGCSRPSAIRGPHPVKFSSNTDACFYQYSLVRRGHQVKKASAFIHRLHSVNQTSVGCRSRKCKRCDSVGRIEDFGKAVR